MIVADVTLRDGNHAVSHQISSDQIAIYCQAADAAGVPIVEVGHGNGLGASSLQLGESACPDETMLTTARANLPHAKLSVHVIPGFGTVDRDIRPAIEHGVDIVRVASHSSEADVTARHIEFVRESGRTVYGVLMMSHLVSVTDLVAQASKMVNYGAEGVIFMDSAGYFLPADVQERVRALHASVDVLIGFHAHNNLGMAIANSVAAVEAGANIVDGASRGFGAGSGNAQLEVMVAVLQRMGYATSIDLYKILSAADIAESRLIPTVPSVSSNCVLSGLTGVFSGFIKPVLRLSELYGVDPRDVLVELGRRKVIAGQEDLIIEIAERLAREG